MNIKHLILYPSSPILLYLIHLTRYALMVQPSFTGNILIHMHTLYELANCNNHSLTPQPSATDPLGQGIIMASTFLHHIGIHKYTCILFFTTYFPHPPPSSNDKCKRSMNTHSSSTHNT